MLYEIDLVINVKVVQIVCWTNLPVGGWVGMDAGVLCLAVMTSLCVTDNSRNPSATLYTPIAMKIFVQSLSVLVRFDQLKYSRTSQFRPPMGPLEVQ